LNNTSFLGCILPESQQLILQEKGAQIFEHPINLPYQPFRTALYNWQELVEGTDTSRDLNIYQHFSKYRFNPPIQEALWQRIHDHSMDEALRDLLMFDEEGMTAKKCVGFMGGHSTLRTDTYYKKAALTAKLLTEAGYFLVSGGGPGIMEAANLGAYLAHHSNADLSKAIKILSKAPSYQDEAYHQQALEVLEKYPKGQASLAIPTWFYGHEPSNLFATQIAKYFSNSIREDTLLAICLYGVVFAPGSAGTTQEIFMDATQNHYGTFNYYSPMVFLSTARYEVQTVIFPLLRQLAWGKPYYNLLYLSDEPKEIVRFIKQHPPLKK
jgi:predicted Rossmann-fold nucleotide-binding protein